MKNNVLGLLAACLLVVSTQSHAGWFSNYFSYTKTKHPIMLVPGIFAFDSISAVDYWYQIPSAINKRGGKAYVAKINAFESSVQRGETLIAQMEEIIATSRGKVSKFNLMGHSQGGITAATLRVNNIEQKLKARVIEGWNCTPDVWPEYSGMNAEKDELVLSLVGHSDPWFSYSNYKLGCGPLLNQTNGSKGIVYKEGFLRYEHAPLDYKKPKEELLNFLTQVIRK